ncbi:MAG: hypothetical protein ACI9WU_000969 [Myxococcota bacterium]|jgi:hypothetical protein
MDAEAAFVGQRGSEIVAGVVTVLATTLRFEPTTEGQTGLDLERAQIKRVTVTRGRMHGIPLAGKGVHIQRHDGLPVYFAVANPDRLATALSLGL